MKINKTVSTKAFADGDAVETELMIDLSNLVPDDIVEYAVQSLVVRWQGQARRAKDIPATATYVAPKPGTRGAPVSREALLRRFCTTMGVNFDATVRKYNGVDGAYEALHNFLDAELTDIE